MTKVMITPSLDINSLALLKNVINNGLQSKITAGEILRTGEQMKYEIYFKNTLIGVLEVNIDGQHKYTPNKEGVEIAQTGVSLSHEMQVESDWREPIPFFKNRIENAKRFSDGKIIGYHTDSFKMIHVE